MSMAHAAAAVIDIDGAHDDASVGRAVAAQLAAIDAARAASGASPAAIAVLGSHGLATYAAIEAALRRAPRIVFVDGSRDLAQLAPVLAALGVELVLDAVGAGAGALASIDVRAARLDDPAVADGRRAPLVSREYAILTTGTTGEPKVILQDLAHLRAHIAAYAQYIALAPGERVLQLASAAWDAGLMDVFACAFHGGVLCSIDPRVHDLARVRDFIVDHAVEVLHMTVPYFRLLHDALPPAYPAPSRMVIGGELISRNDLARFDRALPPGSVLFNAYGPTEHTTALYNRHRHGEPCPDPTWPLAFLVPGVTAELVVDGARAEAPHVTGELVLASPWIARGFDVEARAARSLATDVFGDGTRFYPTGDLAHRDARGQLFITGRKDSVIKVNGQKVSLYEIEAELRALDGLRDVCVIAEATDADARVIAAVVLDAGAPVLGELRRALAQRLAAHKLPKQWLVLDALPLNRNNKLDRARIAALAAGAREAAPSGACEAPGGERDALVAHAARVLGGGALDLALSFRENGGDSLRALSVIAALRRAGRSLALDQLMSGAALGALRSAPLPARGQAATPAPGAALALPNRDFLEGRRIPDLDRWSQAIAFDITAAHAPDALADIVHAVLSRHWPRRVPAVRVLGDASLADGLAMLSGQIDRAAGQLVAAAVVASAHVIIACHQLVIDRVSWLVLASELADGLRQGAASIAAWPAPALDAQAWAAMYQQQRRGDRASEVWDALPWPRSAAERTVELPPRAAFRRTARAIGRDAQPAGALDDRLLAAILLALAEVTGEHCHPIDVLGHGRDLTLGNVDASAIVGWFTVIWPFVLDLTGLSSAEVLSAVATLRTRLAPIGYTFGNEHYRPDQAPRWRCASSYNFLGDVELAQAEELVVNPISTRTMHGAASHSLELTAYRAAGAIELVVDHDPAVVSPADAAALADAVARAFVHLEAR